jgi:hypothetical protein
MLILKHMNMDDPVVLILNVLTLVLSLGHSQKESNVTRYSGIVPGSDSLEGCTLLDSGLKKFRMSLFDMTSISV